MEIAWHCERSQPGTNENDCRYESHCRSSAVYARFEREWPEAGRKPEPAVEPFTPRDSREAGLEESEKRDGILRALGGIRS